MMDLRILTAFFALTSAFPLLSACSVWGDCTPADVVGMGEYDVEVGDGGRV
ncbi:hypothetical protein TUN199_08100 [Pyrenophora tritici-repentis]|nr:hypothetical protein TUN205_08103 [Pyrenophora tritici-repentis]KAI0619925.1 hypothetical protein TUN199_08100 [Pyrenophora tritici-repentis]